MLLSWSPFRFLVSDEPISYVASKVPMSPFHVWPSTHLSSVQGSSRSGPRHRPPRRFWAGALRSPPSNFSFRIFRSTTVWELVICRSFPRGRCQLNLHVGAEHLLGLLLPYLPLNNGVGAGPLPRAFARCCPARRRSSPRPPPGCRVIRAGAVLCPPGPAQPLVWSPHHHIPDSSMSQNL